MKMPWNREETVEELLESEKYELVEILRYHNPGDKEYEEALSKYERLQNLKIEENKLKTFMEGKWITLAEGMGTIILVLTHEFWSPLTARAGSFIKTRFTGGGDDHLLR